MVTSLIERPDVVVVLGAEPIDYRACEDHCQGDRADLAFRDA
jgi:hypothetical protein